MEDIKIDDRGVPHILIDKKYKDIDRKYDKLYQGDGIYLCISDEEACPVIDAFWGKIDDSGEIKRLKSVRSPLLLMDVWKYLKIIACKVYYGDSFDNADSYDAFVKVDYIEKWLASTKVNSVVVEKDEKGCYKATQL